MQPLQGWPYKTDQAVLAYDVETNASYERLSRERESLNKNCVDFIKIEIDIGLTFCRLGRTFSGNGYKPFAGCCNKARRAYDTATRFLIRVRLSDVEFNRLTAKLERLKFDVESLEQEAVVRHVRVED